MPVSKDLCERYSLRDGRPGGEWATIVLRCWENPPHAETARTTMYYCGEILIHSSFGSWGHTWTACATPFKRFLIDAEFDYVFTKFMGTDLDRFDGEASMTAMLDRVKSRRREGGLDKIEAREVWELLEEMRSQAECSEHDFGEAMLRVARHLERGHPMKNALADATDWPRRTRYDYQAAGFWRSLWPLFVDALELELQQLVLEPA